VGKPSLNAAHLYAKAEGRVFILVPAYPGCPGTKAVKRLLLLLLFSCSSSDDHLVFCCYWTGKCQLHAVGDINLATGEELRMDDDFTGLKYLVARQEHSVVRGPGPTQ